MTNPTSTFLREMTWRGQVQPNGCTDLAGFDAHLADSTKNPRRAYVGFDPTADSLTIGNLVGIMALGRWQRAGHTPVALMGGGTGLIGDPSGKSAERTLNTEEVVRSNVEKIRGIFDKGELFVEGSTSKEAGALKIVNNVDWLGKLGFLEALRDIGKHFSVNMMIQKDSVKERLNNRDQGISYTEFSYMILQAYDFYWLRQNEGVTTQMGGSDQFGNIVTGIDLIRKKSVPASATVEMTDQLPNMTTTHKVDAFGLTWPLVTKADGGKFGKTESGAIWLSPHRTSPFAYSQFWLNAADADVVRFLKTFTFLSQDEITALEHQVQTNPGAREAQRVLAREATAIIHGRTEAANAEAAAKALFSGEIAGLPLHTLEEVLASAPSSSHSKTQLESGVVLLDLLVETKLAASKREAKEFLGGGSVSVNGRKAGADEKLTSRDLLHGTIIALRRGKKQWHVTRWA